MFSGKAPHLLPARQELHRLGRELAGQTELPQVSPGDKKESVSLVWAISRRNVVNGKYLPRFLQRHFRVQALHVRHAVLFHVHCF